MCIYSEAMHIITKFPGSKGLNTIISWQALLQGDGEGRSLVLPFSYKMYNRGHLCFLILAESVEALADSVTAFPLDVTTLK